MKRVSNRLLQGSLNVGSALFVAACMSQGGGASDTQASATPKAEPPPVVNSAANTSAGSAAPPGSAAPGGAGAGVLDGVPALLSVDWATRRPAASDADKARSKQLRDQAYALYGKKKDVEAVPLYEQALTLSVTGQLYYEYANSLSNTERLADSVKAYDVAIAVGYEHPEIALYNKACAQSRMKDAAAAFASLDQAVSKGYAATAKMQGDSDLAFLRTQPEWPKRYAEYQQSPNALVGTVVEFNDRENDVYTVCPNGTIESSGAIGLDESCCHSRTLGKLTRKDGAFHVQWLKRCGRKGTGGRQNEGMMEVCQPYKGCTAQEECRAIDKKAVLLDAKAAKELIASPPNKDGEPGDWSHGPFSGPVPAVCSEAF